MDSSALPCDETTSSDPPAPTSRTPSIGLYALALGGFGIGLTEFVIAGLLSDVATDLGVSVPSAGALIWAYALAVVVGAFTVTAALTTRPPKGALLVLLALFVIGNTVTALAPTFELALVGRVITALCHGGFFGIGAVVASDLVPAARKASGIAVMFGGLTLANVLGVPFGTFVGQHLGWRSAFWMISALGVLAILGIAALVPRRAAPPTAGGPGYRVLLRPQVAVSMLLTLTIFGGLFGAFIYVEPLVTQVTGYTSAAVPWLLVLFGIGLFAGNIAGGRLADRHLGRSLRGLAIALPAVLIIYAIVAPSRIGVAVALLALGFVGFATTPVLQLRVLRFSADSPTAASAANVAAFNLGNAIGSALGGLTLTLGLGWRSPVFVGIAMALIGAVLAFINNHEESS